MLNQSIDIVVRLPRCRLVIAALCLVGLAAGISQAQPMAQDQGSPQSSTDSTATAHPTGPVFYARNGIAPIPRPGEQSKTLIRWTSFLPPNQSPAPDHPIPWTQAARHVGQMVTVQGRIVDSRVVAGGSLNLLYFDEAEGDSFYLAVFQNAFRAVRGYPAKTLPGKRVRVRGMVSLYHGRPQIQVENPDQIQVLDESAKSYTTPDPALKTPETPSPIGRTPDDLPIVPWDQARQYVGQTIAAQGRIVSSRNIGDFTFLNFDRDWRDKFYIVIYREAYDDIPGNPEGYYMNKTIRVTGEVVLWKSNDPQTPDRPQIQVHDASRIQILD